MKLEKRVYWESLRKDVTEYVKACQKCQESQLPKTPLSTGTAMAPEYPWDVISIDLMGPFPRDTNQNLYLSSLLIIFPSILNYLPYEKPTQNQ